MKLRYYHKDTTFFFFPGKEKLKDHIYINFHM